MQWRALNVIVRRCLNCGLEHTRPKLQAEELVDVGKRVPIGLVKMRVFEFADARRSGWI